MKTHILKINENPGPTGQLDYAISFTPFINYIKKRSQSESEVKSKFYKYVIKEFEKVYSPDSIVNVTELQNQTKLLELIYTILTPPIVDEKEYFWALSTPIPNEVFFSTEGFYNFHLERKTNVEKDRISSQENLKKKSSFLYKLILEKFYNIPSITNNELLFDFIDPTTGLTRSFSILPDLRFVDIKTKGTLPDIQFDKIESSFAEGATIEELEQILPLKLFRLEGFSIISITEVTVNRAIENIKKSLINHSYQDQHYDEIINSLKTLAGRADIEFGILPFFKVNDKSVIGHDLCEKTDNGDSPGKDFDELFNLFVNNCKVSTNPIIFNSITDEKQLQHPYLKIIKKSGILSYALLPVFYNNKMTGVLEVSSYSEGIFNETLFARLQSAIPLIAQLLKYSTDEFKERIEAVIRDKYTPLQPSVQWKFNEVAWKYLQNPANNEIETVRFENVHPLYGAIDVRQSTHERNFAADKDLKFQLLLLMQTLESLNRLGYSDSVSELIEESENWMTEIDETITNHDEIMLNNFLNAKAYPFLSDIRKENIGAEASIDKYFKAIDESTGVAFKNRRNFEISLQKINSTINGYFDQEQKELQSYFPFYFEKFRTDGIEYDIYVGQSISPNVKFNLSHLQNLRKWQLKSMAEVARQIKDLSSLLPIPLQTTHLIFIHSAPIDISFRNDERRFDVEGGYNIRYHLIKKRIDKVLIKNSKERLTQPGKIALVYFNQLDVREYIEYINDLQQLDLLDHDLEYMELEELQGVSGLKALRVSVKYLNVKEKELDYTSELV